MLKVLRTGQRRISLFKKKKNYQEQKLCLKGSESTVSIKNAYCYCRLTMGFHFTQPLSYVTKVSLLPEYLLGCLNIICPDV